MNLIETIIVSSVLAIMPATALAQPDTPPINDPEITDELDRAIAKGLNFLATTQSDDGSWEGGRFGKNVAITSLACIAMMGDGSTASRGPYSDQIMRGLTFVLESTKKTGSSPPKPTMVRCMGTALPPSSSAKSMA